MGRVDFFLCPNGQVLVNEINTIPGFTKISMYPKMWEVTGLSYSRLIDRLIELALQRWRKEKRLKSSK
jgi:D-alanine-D-alanine ligase